MTVGAVGPRVCACCLSSDKHNRLHTKYTQTRGRLLGNERAWEVVVYFTLLEF